MVPGSEMLAVLLLVQIFWEETSAEEAFVTWVADET